MYAALYNYFLFLYIWLHHNFSFFSPVCYLLVYSFILFSFVRDSVAPKMEAKASATFTVTRSRKRTVVVSFQSDQLAGVRGECVINVT